MTPQPRRDRKGQSDKNAPSEKPWLLCAVLLMGTERAVFLLREAFALEYSDIASVVECSEETKNHCRQPRSQSSPKKIMKNKMNTKMRMLLGLTTITALLMALPVRAGHRPSHGGGSGGGLPYPTASTVRQLIEDINYANQTGGAITISLAPGATFNLKAANNATDGGNGFPVIGSTKPVDLTIIGNGATIERIAVISRNYIVENPFRLFDVASGSSLTLNQVVVKGGSSGSGGAILNQGTLNVMNGSILSGNSGAIYNNGGTVTVSDSTLSRNHSSSGGGIYNNGGTVTIRHSVLSNSVLYYGGSIYNNSGTVTVSDSDVSGNSARYGGGIYNNGGTITIKDSAVNNNSANHYDYPWAGGYGGGIYNSAGMVVIDHSTLTGNTAEPGVENWFVVGGGIFNDVQGTVTVGNDSHIFGNYYDDVNNSGVLYLESTSAIGFVNGNPAISF